MPVKITLNKKRLFSALRRILTGLLVTLIFAEGLSRLVLPKPFIPPQDERSLLYRFDDELGWFPQPNKIHEFVRNRRIFVKNNSDGFRDVNHPIKKTKPRVLVVGDSFTWGYDVEAEDRFTEHLQKKFPKYEFFNMGVSGYGTDQEFILFRKYFKKYNPDHVVVVFCTDNDVSDNSSNFIYDQYAPFFVVRDGALLLERNKIPKSEAYIMKKFEDIFSHSRVLHAGLQAYGRIFLPKKLMAANDPTKELLLEFRGFAETHGISFSVVLTRENPELQEFLQNANIQNLGLTISEHEHYPLFGRHWTEKGHLEAARQIEPFLKKRLNEPRPQGYARN